MPQIELRIRDLEFPLAALHLSIEVTDGLAYLDVTDLETRWFATVSGDFDSLTIRFAECREPEELYYIPLLSFWPSGDSQETICIGPSASTTASPPAITYETCEGEIIPMELDASRPAEVPQGCLWVTKCVVAPETTWGMIKSCF